VKILCATDLEARSDAAIARAHELRDAVDGSLTLLHVVPPQADEGSLERRLVNARLRLAAQAHGRRDVDIVVSCGPPARIVANTARELGAALTIIGPHDGDAFADVLRDSLSERLVTDAPSPILVARKSVRGSYRNVVVALDGSESGRHVIRVAESVPIAADASLAVVHAHEPPYEAMMGSVGVGADSVARYASQSMAQAATWIRRELRHHSREPQRYRVILIDSRPAPAIRAVLRTTQPDLLVLGTRGHGRFRRVLLGSTAHEILRDADCDVLLVPDSVIRATRGAAGHRSRPEPTGPAAA
jgi:universal stress protein E